MLRNTVLRWWLLTPVHAVTKLQIVMHMTLVKGLGFM